jgi:uncharacterized protein YrrD
MKIKRNGKDRSGRVVSAGTMTGNPVKSLKGEDLGKIEEIMLDTTTGRVVCAVLSFGGFLGMGDKLFAVPWAALSLNKSRDGFVLNADQSVLEAAPGFDKTNWPDFSDPVWSKGIHAHYGAIS